MMTKCHPLYGREPSHTRAGIRQGGVTGKVGEFGLTRMGTDGDPKMHYGVDFLCCPGVPIFAAHDGIVTRDGEQSGGKGFGQRIYLSGDGIVTIYAHLSAQMVSINDRVRAGHLLGFSGRSGNLSADTPTHLHFEVRLGDGTKHGAVDPVGWLHGAS